MITAYIPSIALKTVLLFQMACFGLFLGLVFQWGNRLRTIHLMGLAAVVLLPYVSFMRLNPDSYLYVLLSSDYLNNPINVFRVDAGTVGQLVPGLIAVLRVLFSMRILDDPQIISEFMQIVFYVCITLFLGLSWASMKRARTRNVSLGTILGASSLLLLLPTSGWFRMDLHSYNGEALVIVIAAIVILLAFRPPSMPTATTRALLLALTAYVKAQALPVLLLLMLMRNRTITVSGHKVNERVLLLSIAAVSFLVFEGIIMLLGGYPFLSKLPALLRYMHTVEVPSAGAFPDFAAFVSQSAQSRLPLQTLPWAVTMLGTYLPMVLISTALFACLCAVNRRFRFSGKQYLRVSVAYLAVALLSIALPGNKFEHYLLLTLPMMTILARGFSVAGAAIFLPLPGKVAVFCLILIVAERGLLESRRLLIDKAFVHSSGRVSQEDVARVIPYDLIALLRQEVSAGDEVFVHGFDSEILVYTRSHPPSISLGFMMSKTRNVENFCDYASDLRKLAPKFIVDAVGGKWGYVRKNGLALAENPSFKAIILDNYRLRGIYSNIPLYQRVNKVPPNAVQVICGRADDIVDGTQTGVRGPTPDIISPENRRIRPAQ